MSASLVGSEMCIRDRMNPVARAGSCANAQVDEAAVQAVPCPDANSGATVSYTHLTLPTICSV
eukprot:2428666-Alexandrium_andersonii.AAC.1